MGGTVGDGTLSQTGGSAEARGGRAILAPEPAKSFAERAREMFTDYSSTLSPLRSLVPNLGNPIPLIDPDGVSFTTHAGRNQDGEVHSVIVDNDRRGDDLVLYKITENPDTTSYDNYAAGVLLRGEKALEAGKKKLAELLAPIKAVQGGTEQSRGETLNPSPAPERVWI